MPAGLDGNPTPIVTEARTAVLATAAEVVRTAASGSERTLIAVDGRSGAGKSTFADELAATLERSGLRTLRSTIDSFHRPRAERLRLGPTSAEGYYTDSHQLDAFLDELLRPFAQGAPTVLVAAYDEPDDTPIRESVVVGERSVLIVDGLFLQRPELRAVWDAVIFLAADARCDREWLDFLLADLPEDPSARARTIDERLGRARWPRYRHGWARYVTDVDPEGRATLVIDNDDLAVPSVVAP
ncbi:MAG: uridine kinase [Acidimicrobiales bacterium]